MVDITGIDKAKLLAALVNNAGGQGMGYLLASMAPSFTEEQAQEALAQNTRFDYVGGKSCKVDLDSNYLEPFLYDRDNGEGAVARIVKSLRSN